MNTLLKGTVLVSALASMATYAIAESAESEAKALFVQHATSATLSDGTLTLEGIDKHMIAFSDRPMRATLAIPTASLIEIWNKGKDDFAEDPPNAVVIGEVDGKATSLIVEITNPQLADGNLTFNYVILEGQEADKIEKSYVVIDETWWGDLDTVIGVGDDATGQNGTPLLQVANPLADFGYKGDSLNPD